MFERTVTDSVPGHTQNRTKLICFSSERSIRAVVLFSGRQTDPTCRVFFKYIYSEDSLSLLLHCHRHCRCGFRGRCHHHQHRHHHHHLYFSQVLTVLETNKKIPLVWSRPETLHFRDL